MKYSIRIDTILRYKPIIDYIKEEKIKKILEL